GSVDLSGVPVDPAGTYTASLPAGTYSLTAAWQLAGVGPRQREFVSVEGGQRVQHDLVLAETDDDSSMGFAGTVLEPDGSPSPGAFVRAQSGGAGRGFAFAISADEAGRFRVE